MRFWTWVKLRTQEVRWHFKLNENGNKTDKNLWDDAIYYTIIQL